MPTNMPLPVWRTFGVMSEDERLRRRGKRYRLILDNRSGNEHPVHLHRHSFEITKVGDEATSRVINDTISTPYDGGGRLHS
jgi:FtsP/CotA-like multicopper oxidase with cupredoxin domain